MSLKAIKEAVIVGDDELVAELVKKEIDGGTDPKEILDDGLVAGMNVVGQQFKGGEMFIPEVLMAASAMAVGNELIKPLLVGDSVKSRGRVVMGTVEGDLHDIGKKIVGMMLEGAGFEVIDLGFDVKTERFLGALDETQADIVAMSAMLTTTMTAMGKVTESLAADSKYKDVKIMIGGAPVTDDFGKSIGARFSADAAAAVDLAKELS